MLVIDASAAVGAALGERGFAEFGGQPLVAPRLLWCEAPSALHEMSWRGTIAPETARTALEAFLAAPISPRQPASLPREAWRVADRLGWAKTYDAEYVALAQLLGCRLVTLDARLRRGAARVVEVVAPADL